jgi:integrase
MASIYQRGGTWYIKYYVPGSIKPIRKSLQTTEKKIAQAKMAEKVTALNLGDDSPFPTKTPISQVLESFIQNSYSRRDTDSVGKDLSNLRSMFGLVCPSLAYSNQRIAEKKAALSKKRGKNTGYVAPLEAICFEAITTWQLSEWLSNYINANSLKPKTANRYREVLQKLFSYAINDCHLKFPGGMNPAANIKRYRQGAPVIVFLTLEEIDEQLRVLGEHHSAAVGKRLELAVKKLHEIDEGLRKSRNQSVRRRLEKGKQKLMPLIKKLEKLLQLPGQIEVMVNMYVYAGIRREEGMWLQKRDVDLKEGYIRIQAKKVGGREWNPKNGDNRSIPISDRLRECLERYEPVKSDHGWYFPSPSGLWWDPDNFSAALADVNNRKGLRWGCDEYRHTFGSQLAMKGVSLFMISKMMGNSPEICRRHYAALIPSSMVGAVEFPDVDFGKKTSSVPVTEPQEPGERPRLRLVVNNG